MVNASQASEAQPLLSGQRPDAYTFPASEPEVTKKHFNIVGLSPASFWALILSSYSALFLMMLDSSIVAVLLSSISSEFLATNQAQWLGTSFLLAQSCASPISGRLIHTFGRRPFYLFGTFVFGLGTLGCALAPSMPAMIAARALAGAATGCIGPVVTTVSSDVLPLTHRGLFNAYLNVIGMFGVALGGPLGGLVSEWVGWRWAFAGQVPIIVIIGICAHLFLRYDPPKPPGAPQTPPDPPASFWDKFKGIDFAGIILLIASLLLCLVPLSMLASSPELDFSRDWKRPGNLSAFIASAVCIGIFIYVELRIATKPIMPLTFFKSPTVTCLVLWSVLSSIPQYLVSFSSPLFLIIVRQIGPSQTGQRLLARAIGGTLPGIPVGLYLKKNGSVKEILVVGGLTTAIGAYFLSTWSPESPDHIFWWSPALFAIGGGMVVTCVAVTMFAEVGRADGPFAMALFTSSRSIGSVLGVALSGIMLQVSLQKELPAHITGPDAEAIIRKTRRSSEAIRSLPPIQKAEAIAAYNASLQPSLKLIFVISAISGLFLLGVRSINVKTQEAKEAEQRAAAASSQQSEDA